MVEINGTIKEFQFKNPHTWIQVMVDDGKGKEVEWSLEWGARILLDARDTGHPVSSGRQGHAAASSDEERRACRHVYRGEVRRRKNGRNLGITICRGGL